jgi:hypothetical protein
MPGIFSFFPVFSLHKQSLQSEPSLIKGTNLSRSNQVAELARAADNSRLFDHKYIIFSSPAWFCLRPGNGGGSDRSLLVLFLAAPLGRQDESYPNYKWKYPHWTNPSQGVRMAITQLYRRWISIECLWMRRYKDIVDFFFFFSVLSSFLSLWNETCWDSVPVQLRSHPKADDSLLQFSNPGSNNTRLLGEKWISVPCPQNTSLPITVLTGSKHVFFFMRGTGILNDGQVYRLCGLRSATEVTQGFTLQFRHKATPSTLILQFHPYDCTTTSLNHAPNQQS